jgi:hypothetical protein
VRAKYCSICRRQFGPPGHTNYDDSIGEDGRLFWLVCQRVNAAERDEERPHYEKKNDPSPAAQHRQPTRLVRHATTGWMSPRRMADARRSGRNLGWH